MYKIFFKSGAVLDLKMKSCTCRYQGDELIGMTWETEGSKVLFISLKDVDAVIQFADPGAS